MNIRRSACILFGLAASITAPAEPDHTVSNAVVQIRGLDPKGRMYFGSGVVTAEGQVATNCHVVRSGGRIAVFRGMATYPVVAWKAAIQKDLCLLDAPGVGQPVARLGRIKDLKSGTPLYFYGYPRALGMSHTAGALKALHPYEGSSVIETSAFFTLGGSGGGIFNNRGQLVGLATFMAPGHSGSYYAIPAEWIAQVKRLRPVRVDSMQGLSFWEDSQHIPDFLSKSR